MIAAVTNSWPEAAVAMAGILFVTVVLSVAIWQILATGRAGLSAKREQGYRKLAEEATEAQQKTAEQLGAATSELAQLRTRISELERVLKEVE